MRARAPVVSPNHFSEGLANAESMEKDDFLLECNVDPSILDNMSIISRSYENKKRVLRPFLYLLRTSKYGAYARLVTTIDGF